MTGAAKRGTRGRPRREDVAAIEKKLLTVALQEFLGHGYGGASLTRIVREAGVSKTTLYSRFASKEELFRAIMNRQIERISPAAILGLDSGDSPDLVAGLTAYADHMLKVSLRGDLLGVNRLIYSESHRFPELGAAAAERTARGVDHISQFIRDCAHADGIPCARPRDIAEAFILMHRGWYINVMLTNRRVTSAQRRRWAESSVRVLLSSRAEW